MNIPTDSIAFHEAGAYRETGGGNSYRRILAHYLNLIIPSTASVLEIGCGAGQLLALLKCREKAGVDASPGQIEKARARCPDAHFVVADAAELQPWKSYDVIVVSDTLNHCADAQRLLEVAGSFARPDTRLVITCFNTLWRPVLKLASLTGLRSEQPALNWLSGSDVRNLAELAGWEIIKSDSRILLPLDLPGLSALLNRILAPLAPWFCLSLFTIARRRAQPPASPLTVSVVVPARNEAGNIPAAVARMPEMGKWTEIIFIEGHSRDDTWAAIQRVQAQNPDRRIKIARQTGKGKGDAVRAGFALAEGDVLMILDADLTMPPEDLPKFYHAVAGGSCEFANGCRLVYPMEERAMQFLNLCANKLFGILFSWLLGQSVKDTLCGTKVLTKDNYEAIAAQRSYFGDFDPFGDFDLLFGADKLNLKIRDIPVRYRERTYGETNIQRFRHGLLLFRMVAFAARKLKFI